MDASFVDSLRALVQPASALRSIDEFLPPQAAHYLVKARKENGVLWFPLLVTRAFTEKDAGRVPPGATWKECRTVGLDDIVRLLELRSPAPCLVARDVLTARGDIVKQYAVFDDNDRAFDALRAMPPARRTCLEVFAPGGRVRFFADIDITERDETAAGRPWAPAEGSDPYWAEIVRIVAVAREIVARAAGWTLPVDEEEANDALGVVILTAPRADKHSYHVRFGNVSFDGLATMAAVAAQINAALPIRRLDECAYRGRCLRFPGACKLGTSSALKVAYAPKRFTDREGPATQLPCDPIEEGEKELFKACCVSFGAGECQFRVDASDVSLSAFQLDQ